ncbi:MAG: ketoacyl-ACP synthase III [Pseudobutyrivibrio sp.]|nr:ketoacyl-ACP synthase III [Pseudobutyrivibrio sp.]
MSDLYNMVINTYSNIKIAGIAAAASSKWQSLEEAVLESGLGDEDFNLAKFKKNTGVTGRYVAGDFQTASDFCYKAAEELIKRNNLNREEIGVLVFVSQFPDYPIPATACVLHKRLNLPYSCISFDVNLGCSGFVYGINIASALLSSCNCKYGLVLCGDTCVKNKSRGRDRMNGSHSILYLFGDGGSATLLEKENDNNVVVSSCTDGNGFNSIMMPEHSWRHPWLSTERVMDDMNVFNFSITQAPEMIKGYMKHVGSTPDDYDGLILHQANKLIIDTVTKRSGFTGEKSLTSIDKFANTSCVSIPNTIVHHLGTDESKDIKRYLCCGFGVGLSWAAMEINISPKNILPLIHTDEWFDDGLPEE